MGQTTRVYREFYLRTWESAPSLEQFQSIRARGQRVWVVHTLDRYIEGRTPDLMRMLRAECVVQQVFRGTVGDGDVTVCVAPPVGS